MIWSIVKLFHALSKIYLCDWNSFCNRVEISPGMLVTFFMSLQTPNNMSDNLTFGQSYTSVLTDKSSYLLLGSNAQNWSRLQATGSSYITNTGLRHVIFQRTEAPMLDAIALRILAELVGSMMTVLIAYTARILTEFVGSTRRPLYRWSSLLPQRDLYQSWLGRKRSSRFLSGPGESRGEKACNPTALANAVCQFWSSRWIACPYKVYTSEGCKTDVNNTLLE